VIAHKEEIDYTTLRNLAVCALLHDSSFMYTSLEKINSSQIDQVFDDPKSTRDDKQAILDQAIQSRREHMEKSAILARLLMRNMNLYLSQKFTDEDYAAKGKRHRLNMVSGGFEYICD